MRFELEDGGHTEVFFYKDVQGVTHPFPAENAEIVKSQGTEEDKEMLERILKDGVESLEDRMHVAFAGPPIPPYKIKCYCGHTITVGLDKRGYYIEGANLVIFEPGSERRGWNE